MLDQSDALVICGAPESMPDAAAFARARGLEVRYYKLII